MKIVIVGAGIFGASVAYHAAREGADAVLVDREDEGRATQAGAGIVCPWGSKLDHPADYALLEGGGRYYPTLVAALAEVGETDLSYARVGALFAPDDRAELDRVELTIRRRAGNAPEVGHVERLAPVEARKMFPPLREDLEVLHVSGGARVNGRKVSAALARAAAAHGARRITGAAALIREGGRVAGVRVGAETFPADAVVVAAGAWASELLAPLGVAAGVQPQRGQIVHLRRPGTDTSRWPTIQPINSYYLLAFEDSRVVVGASREFGSGFDHRLTAAGVSGVLNAGLNTAPGLADWTIEEIRIGFRPLADDARPVIGRAPGVAGLFIANGLGPSGLTMGPYAGSLLAQAVLGRATEIDLAAFDPGRFRVAAGS
ncbi:MAG TPA: FAD-binding oxidoreductase [Acetobacteraceae bacterium]|jgi:D-amino-acid dehydrogenase|nr:FAD-binding oxidoreductase [Acetobacteraceae bacterium]